MTSGFYRYFWVSFKNDSGDVISSKNIGYIGSSNQWITCNSVIPDGTKEITIYIDPGALIHEIKCIRIV